MKIERHEETMQYIANVMRDLSNLAFHDNIRSISVTLINGDGDIVTLNAIDPRYIVSMPTAIKVSYDLAMNNLYHQIKPVSTQNTMPEMPGKQ